MPYNNKLAIHLIRLAQLLCFHRSACNGSCHDWINGVDYCTSILGCVMVHAMAELMA